jgi:hypothetical protein
MRKYDFRRQESDRALPHAASADGADLHHYSPLQWGDGLRASPKVGLGGHIACRA